MEVLKNAISVLSLLVAILGSIVAIKNLIKNKKNKEEKIRWNDEIEEEKKYQEVYEEKKKTEAGTGISYGISGIVAVLSNILSEIALRVRSNWGIALIIICLIMVAVLVGYTYKTWSKLKLREKIVCVSCASVCALVAVLVTIFGNVIHVHIWKAATCTEAKTCQQCGEVEGTALGHNWANATCTEAKTCRQCGEVTGTALGHDWNEATCTEAKTCRQCGEVMGTALGHDWNKATCTEAKTCRQCGEVTGTALGHDWNEATCITARKCSTCGITDGVALGHKYDSDTDLNCNVCSYVRGYWSDYSAWSAWQDTSVTGSIYREVDTQKVVAAYTPKIQYKYSRYYGWNEEDSYWVALGNRSGYCKTYEETVWLDEPLRKTKEWSNVQNRYNEGYGYGVASDGKSAGKKIFWYNEQTQEVDDLNSPIYKTQYRYRDRYIIYY